MDRRYYQRTVIKAQSNFIILGNDPKFREFGGVIEDISEGGIRIFVDDDRFDNTIATIKPGSRIYFQAYDEFDLYDETREVVFEGEVCVLRINEIVGGRYLGCKIVKLRPDLEEYIRNRKLAVYLDYAGMWV